MAVPWRIIGVTLALDSAQMTICYKRQIDLIPQPLI